MDGDESGNTKYALLISRHEVHSVGVEDEFFQVAKGRCEQVLMESGDEQGHSQEQCSRKSLWHERREDLDSRDGEEEVPMHSIFTSWNVVAHTSCRDESKDSKEHHWPRVIEGNQRLQRKHEKSLQQ
mmetsp:Transcript_19344/g.16168  ORF Transcript_19344/g.16168 Transcript_19344/m.16168 type:complete len:127 (+) Transcript_19344:186-566(+)